MWGLGCLLYEMLALEHPFQGSNLAELSVHVMNAEYKPVPARYSTDLQALLRALLSATPADRPTAAALLTTPVLRWGDGFTILGFNRFRGNSTDLFIWVVFFLDMKDGFLVLNAHDN